MTKLTWPCWFSSPDGKQSDIFQQEFDVPRGWTTGAEKITISDIIAPAEKPAAAPKRKKSAAPAETPEKSDDSFDL